MMLGFCGYAIRKYNLIELRCGGEDAMVHCVLRLFILYYLGNDGGYVQIVCSEGSNSTCAKRRVLVPSIFK